MIAPGHVDPPIDTVSLYKLLRLALGRPLTVDRSQWPKLLAFAERERLLGVAWRESAGAIRRDAPDDVAASWQRRAVMLGLFAERQLDALAQAVRALVQRGVPAVVLKGFPLAQRLYEDFTVRPLSDSDLYVPIEYREAAATSLSEAGWHCVSGAVPEEQAFSRRDGRHSFMLEVHSSALDDPLLDHIRFPIEQCGVAVGGHQLPAHSGRFLPAYLAAHLAKHHDKPLLWMLDFATLWSMLDASERTAAFDAAREAKLSRHLAWAVETTAIIESCRAESDVAAEALIPLQRALDHATDRGRVMRLVALSDTAGDALRVVGGRLWPAASRVGWRNAPRYFARRTVYWAYRHVVFERPVLGGEGTSAPIALSASDSAQRLRRVLDETSAAWVSPGDGSMEPAIPRFATARVVKADARPIRVGDVIVASDEQAKCALRRVTWLGADGLRVKGDSYLNGEQLISHSAALGVCDLVQVGEGGTPIESRPHGSMQLLQTMIRSRWTALTSRSGGPTARTRMMYVFDLGSSAQAAALAMTDRQPGAVASEVEFRELRPDEIQQDGEMLGAGGQAARGASGTETGCVVGMLSGRKVYHVWYVRGGADRFHGAPDEWRPRGKVVLLHDGYTEPEFRGRGIHSAALRWMLNRERSADTAHAIGIIHRRNTAARRAVESVGFRFVGRVS